MFESTTYVETPLLTEQQRNCLAVAQAIREESCIKFNMSYYSNVCGTSGCIAGTTIALLDPVLWRGPMFEVDYSGRAQELLGLTNEQRTQLFFAQGYVGNRQSKEQAAETLERFARTGRVEWL